MDTETVLQQLEYHYWATDKMLSACELLAEEQLHVKDSSAFGSPFALLVHMLSAEDIWLNRWQGKEVGFTPAEDYTDLKHLKREWHGQRQRMEAFLAAADVAEQKEARGHRHHLWQMVLHMIDHSSFHRGQVVQLLRVSGVTPPQTNFIHFLRKPGAG